MLLLEFIYKFRMSSTRQSFVGNCTYFIGGVADPGQKWQMVDITIALTNFTLQAADLGYGTCWIFDFFNLTNESTDLFLLFIQSGDHDWKKAMLPRNGYFFFVGGRSCVVKLLVPQYTARPVLFLRAFSLEPLSSPFALLAP